MAEEEFESRVQNSSSRFSAMFPFLVSMYAVFVRIVKSVMFAMPAISVVIVMKNQRRDFNKIFLKASLVDAGSAIG